MKKVTPVTDHERERKFVSDPMEWPKWPILPMKRRDRPMLDTDFCGFMLAEETPPYKVYVGMIFVVFSGAKTIADAVKDLPVKQYSSSEEMLQEWAVD